MDHSFEVETEASAAKLFSVLSDLSTYPNWLDLVSECEPATETDDENAWVVTLKARVGPFSRSKRLRMVKTAMNAKKRTVTFERQELDGRQHSAWLMTAQVSAVKPSGSAATIVLTYDGSKWSGILDGVLDSAADRSKERLRSYVTS